MNIRIIYQDQDIIVCHKEAGIAVQSASVSTPDMVSMLKNEFMAIVLINGGARGIGRAMVELFSLSGHSVAFTYKNSDATAGELSALTGALAIKADSACEQDVKMAVRTVVKE